LCLDLYMMKTLLIDLFIDIYNTENFDILVIYDLR
jgi:hypothetical protein